MLHFLWRRSCTPSIHRTRAIREERLGSYSILSYNAHRRSASFQINSSLQLLRSTPSVKGHWVNRTDATGNGILNGKNESDVRIGLTSVCQLLYFPISCFFISPYWCTLSPNSPIEKKEISNDRTRPMKADQGFYSLAKRAHYSASITEAKAMRPIDQPKSILIKE